MLHCTVRPWIPAKTTSENSPACSSGPGTALSFGAVAKESNRRFVDWRFAQGNPGMGIIGKPEPPVREDFYHEYEDVERMVRLWHERTDRWR